jgi:hypothetical protein
MQLEDQVASEELCKKLKELGCPQKSKYYWQFSECWYLSPPDYKEIDCPEIYSAYTVAELGELLPALIMMTEGAPYNNFWLVTHKHSVKNIQYTINYICDTTSFNADEVIFERKLTNNIYDEKEADARAKMLIYLIENGLLKWN